MEPNAGRLRQDGGRLTSDLEMPVEAFVRLVYGRLEPAHTPDLSVLNQGARPMTLQLGVYSFGDTPRTADGGYGATAKRSAT